MNVHRDSLQDREREEGSSWTHTVNPKNTLHVRVSFITRYDTVPDFIVRVAPSKDETFRCVIFDMPRTTQTKYPFQSLQSVMENIKNGGMLHGTKKGNQHSIRFETGCAVAILTNDEGIVRSMSEAFTKDRIKILLLNEVEKDFQRLVNGAVDNMEAKLTAGEAFDLSDFERHVINALPKSKLRKRSALVNA